ncbi:MAG: TIGR01777 family oxidoreductase [Acidimicrobiales bacterium]
MGLHHSSVVAAPIETVFAWHERPGALARLLPPWQPIRIGSAADSLRDGRTVLVLPGGVRWVAQHGAYDPPHQFADRLVSLPLRWHHLHRFEEVDGSATRVLDTVETPVPEMALRRPFRYRHRQLADDLAAHDRLRALRDVPLTIALTGASGLVGSALSAFLSTGGHRVIRLVRRSTTHPDEREWRPEKPDPDAFAGLDAVVHLAGESIAGRFTHAHRRAIRDSRIEPTRRIAEVMAKLEDGPRVLVTASAIGFYGPDRGDTPLAESAARGGGFLADVVADWEAATGPAADAGVRVVHVRTGIVQSARGGTLRIFRRLFETGLGGRLGDGRQWLSWIDLDDLTDIYARAILDGGLSGPVNAVAPEPVRNREYTATLARVLRRPAVLPVPSFGPRLLLGAAGARELAHASQRVDPVRLADSGHVFRRPDLGACLRHQLGRLRP